MKVKLTGRGSNDVLADIRKQNNTESMVTQIKSTVSDDKIEGTGEYGYDDESYIRYVYNNIMNNSLESKGGAFLIVLRIAKITRLYDIDKIQSLVDMTINQLISILSAHIIEVKTNPDSFGQSNLNAFDIIVREICDITGTNNIKRVDHILTILKELF